MRSRDRYAHLLEVLDGAAAKVAGHVLHREVEVAAVIEGNRRAAVLLPLGEQEELDLAANLQCQAKLRRLIEHPAKSLAAVAWKWGPVGGAQVAEHPRHPRRP